MLLFPLGLPEHYPAKSDGPLPVLQSGFPCQVDELLGTDELLVELHGTRRQQEGYWPDGTRSEEDSRPGGVRGASQVIFYVIDQLMILYLL